MGKKLAEITGKEAKTSSLSISLDRQITQNRKLAIPLPILPREMHKRKDQGEGDKLTNSNYNK